MSDEQIEKMLTPKEVCNLLSVKLSWLYDQTQANNIPHYKLGGRFLRFKEDELREYIAGRYVPVKSDQHVNKMPAQAS